MALIRGDESKGMPALKTILFWNGLFYYPDYAFGRGRQPFIDAKCPVTTCLATDDPYLLDSVDQYDAVMFHWPSLCDYPYISSRSEHQLFVMVSDESPQVFHHIMAKLFRLIKWCISITVEIFWLQVAILRGFFQSYHDIP